MKIMCVYSACGPSFVRTGWGRVFASMGHDFIFWDPAQKSAFDAFSELEPDVFLGTSYDLDDAIYKCISRRPHLKVALVGSMWGPLIDTIDLQKYPITVAQPEEKKRLERLKAETGQPQFVFTHITDKYLEETMGGWRTIGILPVGILNAADVFMYFPGRKTKELISDVAYVGGRWTYKARNLDSFLLPLCSPETKLKIKIFGNQSNWPVIQYLGHVEDNLVRDIFASATVCPNVSESHSTDLGFDCVERPFKVMSAGGFCVSDYVDEFRSLFTERELIMCHTPTEFRRTIQHFINNPQQREPYVQAGQLNVLTNHTYFNRVTKLLSTLGLSDEADKCDLVQRQIVTAIINNIDKDCQF